MADEAKHEERSDAPRPELPERVTPQQMAAGVIEARAARMEAQMAAAAEQAPEPPPTFALPRPVPVALIVVGIALVVGFVADLAELWPPEFANWLWQTDLLERFFNLAITPLLGGLFLLVGLWLADALEGTRSRLRLGTMGGLAVGFGLGLILAFPLYLHTVHRIVELRTAELNRMRVEQRLDADQLEAALKRLKQTTFGKQLRYGANAAAMGSAAILLGMFAIRSARRKADVAFNCPRCESTDVRLAKMNRDERSLALFTRLHTFSCRRCGRRFVRFSLTGKPYTFFF
ncbi:hypothetical protein [Gloeobacter kilaueensis]|uniref:Uncharacterized protein n=1 Tax=Gloeobacter kilaueensis (strain ATCC BAA-2537 / CCAP 1431/1 / ULC 316 / JS1) TaxID=1183438 RepID=U5QNY7_GLOK1|nr:hypothetical protein [Gloeobacter kilaueensis]AGY60656.1 hypothetical protein GKIL_4410 [Gloeobacter kilaueensis JS1]